MANTIVLYLTIEGLCNIEAEHWRVPDSGMCTMVSVIV